MLRRFLILISASVIAVPCLAQQPTRQAPEPSIRRWMDLQVLNLYSRYRFIESNRDVVTSNDQQYRETARVRFNADAKKRYTLTLGFTSGTNFIGSWDNTGAGKNDFQGKHAFRQLFGSAIPVNGLELQVGSLYISKGETTENISYDDDGYVFGERASLRRPKQFYFDEISFTQAGLAPSSSTRPNLFDRGSDFTHQHYTQVLASKRFTSVVAGSADFTEHNDADTLRAAITLRLKPTAPVTLLRYEQYHRFNAHEASGFSAVAERPITAWLRVQAGYASVDQFYGNLNADRIQNGRHYFGTATFTIHGPLTAAFFAAHALNEPYAISNRTRFDVIVQYDAAAALRARGKA